MILVNTPKEFSYVLPLTLFDDESTRKKFTVMDKFDVIVDDERNHDFTEENEALEDFLQFGKTYEITVTFKEI